MNRSLQPVFRPQVGRLPSEPLPAFVARVVMLAAGDAAVDDSATGDGDGGYTAMVAGESLAAFCAQKNTLRARTPIPGSGFFDLFRSSLKFNNPLGFGISKRQLSPAHASSFFLFFCFFFVFFFLDLQFTSSDVHRTVIVNALVRLAAPAFADAVPGGGNTGTYSRLCIVFGNMVAAPSIVGRVLVECFPCVAATVVLLH
jgi:hypothetical protein